MQTFHAIIMLNFRTVFSALGLSDICRNMSKIVTSLPRRLIKV